MNRAEPPEVRCARRARCRRVKLEVIYGLLGDLDTRTLDDFVPLPQTNGVRSLHDNLQRRLRDGPMTNRQVWDINAGTFVHRMACGTVETVADRIQDWFENRACDGFNLLPAYMLGPAFDFIDRLMPELHRRRLFHAGVLREYAA